MKAEQQTIPRKSTGNPKLSRAQKQRIIATIVGAAIGDALGAPFEFKPGGRYRERFPQPVLGGIGEMTGGGGFAWAPGEFTDDTQMAVVQARSLLACGGVDGADLFARFRSWMRTANAASARRMIRVFISVKFRNARRCRKNSAARTAF